MNSEGMRRGGGEPTMQGGEMAGGFDSGGLRRCFIVKGQGKWALFLEVIDGAGVGRSSVYDNDDRFGWYN